MRNNFQLDPKNTLKTKKSANIKAANFGKGKVLIYVEIFTHIIFKNVK